MTAISAKRALIDYRCWIKTCPERTSIALAPKLNHLKINLIPLLQLLSYCGLRSKAESNMLKMVVGHTEQLDEELAAEELLSQCMKSLNGVEPQAALLLASHDLDLADFLPRIRAALGDVELIGCSTLGPLCSASDFVEGASTLTVFASDVIEFGAGLGINAKADPNGAARQAVSQATSMSQLAAGLCITTCSIEGLNPTALADALHSAVGKEVVVFGGGAVPDYPISMPWVGSNQVFGDQILTDAIPVLMLMGPLKISTGVAHGWQPVGKQGVITRASGDLVYEIDGEPLIDFYRHYLGSIEEPALGNPLAVHDESTGRSYLRAPIAFEKDEGAARVLGELNKGAAVQVSMADNKQILDGARDAIAEALQKFPSSTSPECALVVSCCTRCFILGSAAGEELKTVQDALGDDVPISGFYGYGEIAPLCNGATTSFHNETCTTVLLGT